MSFESPALRELRYGVKRYLSMKSAYSPQFSADDSSVTFLSDISGVPQAWQVGLDGTGWPQQLTPGSDRVSFVSRSRTKGLLAFGVDSEGDEKYQIRVLEDGDQTVRIVTDEPSVVHNWGDWSPDETQVCFSSNARNPSFFDLYVQSLSDDSRRLVHEHDGTNFAVGWSPDGSSILMERVHAPFNTDLYLLRLSDGSLQHLTAHEGDASYSSPAFDPTGRYVYCIADEGREFSALARIDVEARSFSYLYTEDWEFESLALSPDGSRVAFTVNEDGYSRLMTWRVGSDSPQKVEAPRSVIGGLTWSNSGEKLAFTLSSSVSTPDVWVHYAQEGRVARLTRSSTCGIPESSFSEPELIRYASFDGLEVPAFLYRTKESGRAPLLVYLHGGPEAQFRPGFSPLLQYFLRLGFAVVAPNFRGSTGYGRRYTHLDDVRGRMDTVKDALAAVAAAEAKVEIDRGKVVAWGGSYGGFMVLACLYTQPEVWAAGVDIVGISNFVTFLKNTGPWRRKLRIAEYGDPEKDGEFLEAISPTTNAHLITAPLFIIHGANDPRVPLGEATQIMQTLENLGREAHLMNFDDEGHGLVKLDNRVEGYSRALGFVMHHISSGRPGPSSSP